MQNDKDNSAKVDGANEKKVTNATPVQPENKKKSEQNTKNTQGDGIIHSDNDKETVNSTDSESKNVEDNAKDETVKDETVKDETVKDETVKDETVKDETVKDETVKDETVKDETVKDKTVKDETVKDETVKEETPKDETTKETENPITEKTSDGEKSSQKADDEAKVENAETSENGEKAQDNKKESDNDSDNVIHSDSSGEKKDNLDDIKKDKSAYNGVKTEDEEENGEENDVDEEEDNQKKPFRVLKGVIYTVCILLFSILLAVIILISVTDYLGMFRPYKSANVKIPKNATTSQVADILQDKGIIRSSLIFKMFAKPGKNAKLQEGTYTLSSTMSYKDIVKMLKSAKNRSTVSVTIPEGYSITKIAETLENKQVCSKTDFLKACNSDKIEFDFQKEIPSSPKRLYRLEGYLFPDTYEFYLDTPAETVVKKMLTTFDKRVDKDVRNTIKKSGMSVDDAVKLASVIQAETGGSKEMANVSSVFHNRLKNGYQGNKMLQSDVTVLYGTKIIEPAMSNSDESKKIAETFNTYKVAGLPAGAINSPGLAAIKAAANPSNTSYYFFVTDKKGNYYYARTYQQHKINCQKALKNGEAAGTDTK